MQNVKQQLMKRLWKDQGGSVMVMIGGTFLLLAIVVGFSIDYTRAQLVRDKMQSALDAAALAGAKRAAFSGNDLAITMFAQRMFWANFPQGYMGTDPTGVKLKMVQRVQPFVPGIGVGLRFEIDPTGVETYMMRAFGMNKIDVQAAAEVQTKPIEPLEVVYSLDVSGSMHWQDGTGGTCLTTADGCPNVGDGVSSPSRMGRAKNAMLWLTALFMNHSSTNSSAWAVVPWDPEVFAGPALTSGGSACFAGDHLGASCASQSAVQHFSTNWPHLQNYISNIPTAGNTDSSNGMFWALQQWARTPLSGAYGQWRDWRWGGSNNSPVNNKVIILITDGVNTASYSDHTTSSAGNSYQVMQNICSFSKAVGVQIFTIVYNFPPAGFRQPYRDCATSHDHYFDAANGPELLDVLERIGGQLMTMRLVN